MLFTSNLLKIQSLWVKERGWRKIHHVNTNKKKAGITVLISEKRKTFKNEKGGNSPRRYNNPKCVCTS